MPSLLSLPPQISGPTQRVRGDLARQQEEEDKLRALKLRALEREDQAATMAGDAAQWADAYKTPEMPPEARQHFADAYPLAQDQVTPAWNAAQMAKGATIPGLENMSEKAATVDAKGNISRTYVPSEAVGAIDPSLMGEAAFAALPESEQTIAKAIASYNMPISALGRFKPDVKQRILAAAQQGNPNFNAAEYPNRQASRKAFTSGPQAANITSLNTVVNHLEGLLQAHKDLGNSRFPIYNRGVNALKSGTGNPNVTKFDVNANAVASELAKLMKGSGVPTASEMEEWRQQFAASMSPEQLKASVEKALELMAGRIDGLRNQWQSAYDEPRALSFLDPNARAILKRLGYDPHAIDPGDDTPSTKAGEVETGVPVKSAQPQPSNQSPSMPQVGEIRKGYRFRGGNPADRNSWEKVQ